jgi:hypothetical protein
MKWVYDDGGRWEAGYRSRRVGDCVTRAIAIATAKPYQEVYEALRLASVSHAIVGYYNGPSHRRRYRKGYADPDKGIPDCAYRSYLAALGWAHIPAQERKVCLAAGELPNGRLIVEVSKHLVAVIDGVIHDTHDCSAHGRRFVKGYFAQHIVGPGFILVEGT